MRRVASSETHSLADSQLTAHSQHADSTSQSTPGALEDRHVIDRCVVGDAAAWDLLFERQHNALLTYIANMLGPNAADSDLIEEIAARVWYALVKEGGKLLNRFDASRGCRLTTFIGVLAKNELAQHFRSERRRRLRELSAAQVESQSEQVTHQQLNTMLADFLNQLTPREREFFERHLLAESETGLLSKANRWQLRHRIRRKLAVFLEKKEKSSGNGG